MAIRTRPGVADPSFNETASGILLMSIPQVGQHRDQKGGDSFRILFDELKCKFRTRLRELAKAGAQMNTITFQPLQVVDTKSQVNIILKCSGTFN